MGPDHLGDLCTLLGEGRAQVLGGPQVPRLALGSGQHVVGDRAYERLGEGVLAAFGRELVGADREHFFSHERAQQLVEVGRIGVGDGLDRLAGEASAEHRALLNEPPFVGSEGVEARGDERRQPGRDLELAELADEVQRPVVALLEHALVEQAPDRLDRVERDPLGALDDACPGRLGQARDEPVEQLAHDLVREGVEGQGGDAATREAEALAVRPLRAREHEEEQGMVTRPLEEVVQEVDHPGIGPLQVLHDHDNR